MNLASPAQSLCANAHAPPGPLHAHEYSRGAKVLRSQILDILSRKMSFPALLMWISHLPFKILGGGQFYQELRARRMALQSIGKGQHTFFRARQKRAPLGPGPRQEKGGAAPGLDLRVLNPQPLASTKVALQRMACLRGLHLISKVNWRPGV